MLKIMNECKHMPNMQEQEINSLCYNVIYSNDLRTLKTSFDRLTTIKRMSYTLKTMSAVNDMFEYIMSNSIDIYKKYSKIGKANNNPVYWLITRVRDMTQPVCDSDDIKYKMSYLSYVNEDDPIILDYVLSLMRIKILPL